MKIRRLNRAEIYRRHLEYKRWRRAIGMAGNISGVVRPDSALRLKARLGTGLRMLAAFDHFQDRSNARAKAWQAKRSPEKAAAYKRAWRAQRLDRSPHRAEADHE